MARAATVAAVALLTAPGALGASPREIANDLEDGRLDGSYTTQELTTFLNDATVQGYGNPIVVVQPPAVTPVTPPAGEQVVTVQPTQGVAGAEKVQTRPAPRKGVAARQVVRQVAPARRGALPFTGLDLALMTAGGLALLALGAGMRRLARERA